MRFYVFHPDTGPTQLHVDESMVQYLAERFPHSIIFCN